jgi:hypothetical protein
MGECISTCLYQFGLLHPVGNMACHSYLDLCHTRESHDGVGCCTPVIWNVSSVLSWPKTDSGKEFSDSVEAVFAWAAIC